MSELDDWAEVASRCDYYNDKGEIQKGSVNFQTKCARMDGARWLLLKATQIYEEDCNMTAREFVDELKKLL